MHKHFKGLIAALMALPLLGACAHQVFSARVAYTDPLLRQHQLDLPARQALQYYLSDDIRLVRAAVRGDSGIADGKLISDASRVLDELVIPAGSPGIAVGGGKDWLAVSFAPGTYLYFVSRPQANDWLYDPGAPTGRYQLFARDWRRSYGSVWLGDDVWQAVDGSRRAYLMVDRDALESNSSRSNTLPGRWLYRDGRSIRGPVFDPAPVRRRDPIYRSGYMPSPIPQFRECDPSQLPPHKRCVRMSSEERAALRQPRNAWETELGRYP